MLAGSLFELNMLLDTYFTIAVNLLNMLKPIYKATTICLLDFS